MADSILRLRVQSEEYDQKIKRAAEGIQQYAQKCREAGGTLEHLDDGVEDFVKALGRMDTVSKSAKGSINEMTRAFTDLSVQYNRLTEDEKNSPFGKALKSSLDQLKGRIQDGNNELRNIGSTINSTGGIMDVLAQKFTVNIDALKLFNVGLSAAKAALGVAKDAFFASEVNVDEWGRTMQSAQGLYEGFLNAINNGDISGYLSRMDEIVRAARAAYDEMDKLGTMKTIQSPQFSRQEAENNRLRMMLMTGRYIAPGVGSGLKASMKEGQLLTPDQIKRIEVMLQNGMKTIVSLTGNELKQTGKAIDAYYESLAKQNGMSIQEFRQGTSSWDAYQEKMRGYEQYQKWRSENSFTDAWGNRQVREGNPYQEFKKWGVFRVDKMGTNSYNDLVGLIKQQQQQQQQMYSTLGQAYRTINRAEGFTVRSLLNGGGGGKGGGGGSTNTEVAAITGSIGDYTKQIQELRKLQSDVTSPEAWQGLQEEINHLNVLIKELKGELNVDPYNFGADAKKMSDDYYKETENKLSNPDKIISPGLEKIVKQINLSQTKKEVDLTQEMGKMVGGISSIASGIEALGVELPEGFKNVLSGLQGLISIVSGIATVVTAIQTIQTAQAFKFWSGGGVVHAATGLIVPGNNYSGDMVPSMINSGELILNRAQQGVIASELQNGNGGGMRVVGEIQGEKIVLVANRFLKRSGQGELVTWK